MSIADFLACIADHALVSAIVLVAVPAAALAWGLVQGKGDGSRAPWKYGYTILVYLACVPGTFSAVLVAYALFFTRSSLLGVNAIAYFLPILTMVATLLLIRRRVEWRDVPGFGRLSALMAMMAASFALALLIDRTRIFLGFFGSMENLFLLVIAIFVIIRVAVWLAFGKRRGAG